MFSRFLFLFILSLIFDTELFPSLPLPVLLPSLSSYKFLQYYALLFGRRCVFGVRCTFAVLCAFTVVLTVILSSVVRFHLDVLRLGSVQLLL